MTARRAPLWSLLLQLTVLLLVALVVLIPLLWLLSTSLKGPAEDIFQAPPSLFPAQPSLQAYGTLFSQSPMGRYLLNSTVVSVFSVVANLLFCSLAAFPLARMRFRGRGIVLALVVATILIPFQVVMIPLYLLMVQLGLRNSLMALILPNAATAFGIYLLRQSFLGVPKELEEAARMDGCTALRAGNASLEELVMALHVRRSYFNGYLGRAEDSSEPLTGIQTEEIYKTSRLVSNLTGMAVQPNKAIVGANAFAHESGIHQDGVLKNRLTYEIIDARTIGLTDNRISLGKLSGRSAVRARLEELGYQLEGEDLNDAFARFKELADRKREITDRDLEAIVRQNAQQIESYYQLAGVQVSCGRDLRATATVTLRTSDGEECSQAAIGTGPVDAVCQALNALVQVPNELVEFSVKSVTEGIDAMGEVTIRLRQDGRLYSGHAADTDVVVAAAQAFVNALNRLVSGQKHSPLHPQRAPLPAPAL